MNAEETERWLAALASEELWDDELASVTVDGVKLILMRVAGAAVAYEDKCPHSGSALSKGNFAGGVLTCNSHLWQFDAASGSGINPTGCRLRPFALKEDNGVIYVRLT